MRTKLPSLLLLVVVYAFQSGAVESAQSLSDTALNKADENKVSELSNQSQTTVSDDMVKIVKTEKSSTGENQKTEVRIDRSGVCIIKETKDTVYTITKPDPQEIALSFRGRLDALRERGFGGGGGPVWGVYAINISPIKALIDADATQRGKDFGFNQFSYEPFIMSGAMGFGGLGNGLRLGGFGIDGERIFTSKPYNGDSVSVLTVRISSGGFLIEKAMVKNRFNYVTGGYLGGGSMSVRMRDSDGMLSSFTRDTSSYSQENGTNASFASIELHGACTYTVYRFMHVGLGVSVPMFISTNGFETYQSQFFTVNPSLQIKVIFGNLG